MVVKLVAFSVFVILIAVFINIYYSLDKTAITTENGILFTPDELSQYNGVVKKELYLSILGEVFDVTKGAQHYGSDGSYNAFIGKDASRSFVTGQFKEGELSDDVLDLSADEIVSLMNWKQFYDKEYVRKGVLIGRYFDDMGNPTDYLKSLDKIIESGKKQKEKENEHKMLYPPCNVEWNKEVGSRVWCTTQSGGVDRDWIGYPRQYYQPGDKSHQCVCVQSMEDDEKFQRYRNCPRNAHSCTSNK